MNQKQQLALLQRILKESLKQIEFLILNADKFKELSGGALNFHKVDNYRDAITLVYIAGLNKGILEHTSLDQLFMFLDKGVFNEMSLDSQVFVLQLKREIA